MKKSIICLLMLLCLCLCLVFVACTPEDPGTGDTPDTPVTPDGDDTGKKGEIDISADASGSVNLPGPNETVEGSTPRY